MPATTRQFVQRQSICCAANFSSAAEPIAVPEGASAVRKQRKPNLSATEQMEFERNSHLMNDSAKLAPLDPDGTVQGGYVALTQEPCVQPCSSLNGLRHKQARLFMIFFYLIYRQAGIPGFFLDTARMHFGCSDA